MRQYRTNLSHLKKQNWAHPMKTSNYSISNALNKREQQEYMHGLFGVQLIKYTLS